MQVETGVRNKHAPTNGLVGGAVSRPCVTNGYATVPISSSASDSPPSSFSSAGANFIEHRVSKMDTLAGIAIKYGVEVGDIRRMNGLVTDLQMFAHRSLQIPLPGRHPPSPVMANGSTPKGEQTPPRQHDFADLPQSLKLKPSSRRLSPAMCSLQGYYGLTKSSKGRSPEGTEMSVYKSGKTLSFDDDDDALALESHASDQVHNRHQKTKNTANGCDHSADANGPERFVRMHNPALHTPEILLKEESAAGSVFSGRAGKGLALRPKPGSRTDLDEGRHYSGSGGEPLMGDVSLSVRKSSSASNLSESESSSSIWPTSKWSLKPEAIARPIFDGLPKPIAAWRNKAALD